MTRRRPRLAGLHHVGIHSADPIRLLDFYGAVFDLRPVPLADSRTRGCAYYELGDGVALEVIPTETSGMEHLGFAVAQRGDLFILRDRLRGAGHHTGEIRDVGLLCSLDFHDPDGRRGQLVWSRAQPSDRS